MEVVTGPQGAPRVPPDPLPPSARRPKGPRPCPPPPASVLQARAGCTWTQRSSLTSPPVSCLREWTPAAERWGRNHAFWKRVEVIEVTIQQVVVHVIVHVWVSWCINTWSAVEVRLTVSCPLSPVPCPPVLWFKDHLTDAAFENLLGTTRSDFKRLPKWRQSDLKKKAGLFWETFVTVFYRETAWNRFHCCTDNLFVENWSKHCTCRKRHSGRSMIISPEYYCYYLWLLPTINQVKVITSGRNNILIWLGINTKSKTTFTLKLLLFAIVVVYIYPYLSMSLDNC